MHAPTLVADRRVLGPEVTIVATCSWGAFRYHKDCWISSPRGSGQTRAKPSLSLELLPPEVIPVAALYPGEREIYLYAPPFQTVSKLVNEGERFWAREVASADQIDFDLTIVIADFGHGSDAPVVLDYRNSHDESPQSCDSGMQEV